MWTLILFLCFYLSNIISATFITLRDEQFLGPDKKLKDELARRCAPPTQILAALDTLINQTKLVRLPRPDPSSNVTSELLEKYHNTIARRTETNNTQSEPYTLPEKPQRRTIIDLVLFLLHNVRYRLQEVAPIIAKYADDGRYRIGHIYCMLDKFKVDLLTIYTRVLRYAKTTTMKHLIFYEHLLRRNIDITYTIEYLVYMQTNYEEPILKKYGISRDQLVMLQRLKDKKKTKT